MTCACGCGEEPKTREGRYLPGHHLRKRDHYAIEDRGFATPCWVWRLTTNAKGYGRLRVPNEDRKMLAHRFYYEQMVGSIEPGMQLDHLCRTRACVNPDHLEPVTPMVNSRRGSNAKLTTSRAREVRRLHATGVRSAEIARQFGVSVGTVSDVVRGVRWGEANMKAARERLRETMDREDDAA